MSSEIHAQLKMPGYNVPLNHPPARNVLNNRLYGFPNALDIGQLEHGRNMYNLQVHREILMMQMMNTITEKPQWDQKVFNEEITTKWREEIAQSGQDFTPKMMDWIIKELQWKAGCLKDTGLLRVFDVGVVKSDTAISKDVQEALKEAVKTLENIPADQKDYHPGSDDKVVDLVHPSLFPVIYGQTRVLPERVITLDDCLGSVGQGDIIPIPSQRETGLATWRHNPIPVFSEKFQWLPCDVEVVDGTSCRIVSYINNAHPIHHKALYEVVEKIIARTIPLWNKSLSKSGDERILWDVVEYAEHPDPEPEEPEGEDHDQEAFWDLHQQWLDTRPIILPEPGIFEIPQEDKTLGLQYAFPDTKLQIIVKLANIELSPDNPSYEGGSWHIEGQLNERICASAIYYYDSENITENTLAFRQRGMRDWHKVRYEQQQHEFLQAVFGFGNDVSGNYNCNVTQNLGAVLCKDGRLLTFPNTVQHRVSSFSLADPFKPGHRKILALFLVDPHRRIISSANVPPQREDWGYERQNAVDQALSKLPRELQDIVQNEMESLLSMEEAKGYRLELMKERGLKSEENNDRFEMVDFNLCEH